MGINIIWLRGRYPIYAGIPRPVNKIVIGGRQILCSSLMESNSYVNNHLHALLTEYQSDTRSSLVPSQLFSACCKILQHAKKSWEWRLGTRLTRSRKMLA